MTRSVFPLMLLVGLAACDGGADTSADSGSGSANVTDTGCDGVAAGEEAPTWFGDADNDGFGGQTFTQKA